MVQRLPPEPGELFRHFFSIADKVLLQWDDDLYSNTDTSPRLITLAVQDLEKMLAEICVPSGSRPSETELTRCLDYGLQLFNEMSRLAQQIDLDDEASECENLCFPLALWGARLGAELNTLEPVVNAVARLANSKQQPGFLEELYREVSEVMEATAIEMRQETAESNPDNPWRILLINRAIIATRSHRPRLMDDAFGAIVEYLPEEAPRFFREGIEQMESIGYPLQVREIMIAWFERFGEKPRLH